MMSSSLKEPLRLSKPRSSSSIIIAVILTMSMLAILYFNRPILTLPQEPGNVSRKDSIPVDPREGLSPCGRVVLVTAARHGSTWFISSAEGCTAKESGTFGKLNSQSELWIDHGSVLADISPADAVQYLYRNSSLKVMPGATSRHDDVREFFRMIGKNVPVFVLRRNLEDSYSSLAEAKETRKWTQNKVDIAERGAPVRQIVDEKKFANYAKRLNDFFDDMIGVMRSMGNVWDEVKYENVSVARYIVGERNRCFIKNCNYS